MGVICKLRVENKFTGYHLTARPEIEQYKNQLEWTKNTLQEVEEQAVSTSNVRTLLAQEKIAKRAREEQSSPTTKASSEGFRIVHRKKRPRIYVIVGATNEPQKTTLGWTWSDYGLYIVWWIVYTVTNSFHYFSGTIGNSNQWKHSEG